jgi:hypothetical protein
MIMKRGWIGGSVGRWVVIGVAPAVVGAWSCARTPASANIEHPAAAPAFVVVNGPPGADTGRARGVAWGDLDGDGRPELYVTRGAGFRNTLYRNAGTGLVAVDRSPASVDLGDSEGAAFVDVDSDGDLDLHVVSRNQGRGLLLENDGRGNLIARTDTLLAPSAMSASMACWADVDNDGQLDVFILGYRTGASRMLRGDSGRFVPMIVPAQLPRSGSGRACGWGDVDGDGLPELAVAVAGASNVVLRNRGGFQFETMPLPVSPSDRAYGYGVTWEDVDQDGRLDLFIANFDATNILYLQRQGGWETSPWGDRLASPASKGHTWGDFDLDGNLDLYLGSGTPDNTVLQRNMLYLGTRAGEWRAETAGEFAAHADTSAGTAWADVDDDGDLDLFVANWGSPRSVGRMYRNVADASARGWLKIELRGARSNTMGVGARVSVLTSMPGERRWQHRHLSANTGYSGQNEPIIHFGLGASAVDSLVIRWPSGQVDSHGRLDARQTYRAIEGNASLLRLR